MLKAAKLSGFQITVTHIAEATYLDKCLPPLLPYLLSVCLLIALGRDISSLPHPVFRSPFSSLLHFLCFSSLKGF